MNASQSYTTTSPIETRTVEQSLLAATESMGRAEYLLERLHAAVTGYEPPPNSGAAGGVGGANGIMHDADRLASRLQGFCADLERTSARVTAANVQSLAQGAAAPNYAASGQFVGGRAG